MIKILSFVFNRFFFSFLSGCIINIYLIIYYQVLKKTNPLFSFYSIISGANLNPSFVFIIATIIFSLIIEGIATVGNEYYLDIIKGKRNVKSKKFKIRKYLLNYIFKKSTISLACDYFLNDGKDENPMDTFIADSNKLFNELYYSVNMCARIIDIKYKEINIYRYRDLSFIVQLMRLSFFCISIFSFLSVIFNFILCNYGIIEGNDLLIFNIFTLIISFFLFHSMAEMGFYCGKRYINEVGMTYSVLKLDLLKENKTVAANSVRHYVRKFKKKPRRTVTRRTAREKTEF